MATCDICKRPVDVESNSCSSEFCATMSDLEIAAFKAAKADDWCLFPCSECGCVIDDQYTPGGHCSGCNPKVLARKGAVLLTETLPHLPAELAERVRKFLGPSAG